MVISLSSASAVAACKAIGDLIEVGGGTARVQVYSAPRPATVDTAVSTQTVLIEWELPDDVFGDPVASATVATATAITIPPVEADAVGTASWFRVFNKAGNPVYDGSCSVSAGTGDMRLSTTSISTGLEVRITTWTNRMPKSA